MCISGGPGRRWRLAGAALALAACLAWPVPPAAGAGPEERSDRYTDLYTAQVRVEDRADLGLALGRAMRAMLVRLTGSRRPEESPGVREAVASPERFVQQYLFASGDGRDLTVKFDPGAVDRLVEQLGLGRWSRVRPRVIVWLAVEDAAGRKSYVDSASPTAAAVEGPAGERGVPFILPLFDIEDRMTLPVSILWGGFQEPIQRASRRYAADAILTGRVYRRETGLWTARWTLFGDLSQEFLTSGEGLPETVAEGLHEAADRFAARFAMRGAAAATSRTPIVVDGVERLEDYARLLRYLASIDIVEAVQVERVEGARIRLALEAKGGRAALAEVIALGRTLSPAEGSAPDRAAGEEPPFDYRLR